MSVPHQLTGYDKRTEKLVYAYDIPRTKDHLVRDVAGVPQRDTDGLGSYHLSPEQARKIAAAIGARINTDRYDWFVEPAATEGSADSSLAQATT